MTSATRIRVGQSDGEGVGVDTAIEHSDLSGHSIGNVLIVSDDDDGGSPFM